jgi:hypothetical protein
VHRPRRRSYGNIDLEAGGFNFDAQIPKGELVATTIRGARIRQGGKDEARKHLNAAIASVVEMHPTLTGKKLEGKNP